MRQIRHILCLLAAATLTACSQTDDTTAPGGDGQLTIKFTAEPTTRTMLTGNDNVQHVKYVQVYVFEGTEANAAEATCVASENAGWLQTQAGGTATQYYTLKTELTEGTTYTVLAVGLDTKDADQPTAEQEDADQPTAEQEGAGYAYGLPGAIKVDETTLAQAIATLAEGRTKADMAKAELFAGSGEITIEANTNKITEITMMRRVAGVMMYLTNIDPQVSRIVLQLHQPQNTQMPLIAQETDFGSTPLADGTADGNILLDVEITHELLQSEVVTDDDGNVLCTKQQGSVLAGAYMIPVNAPAASDGQAVNTLTLIQYKADRSVFSTRRVLLKNNGEEDPDQASYAIRTNYIYSIGTKNATTDEPEDIGGKADADIYIDGNWQADIVIPM